MIQNEHDGIYADYRLCAGADCWKRERDEKEEEEDEERKRERRRELRT